MKINILSIFLLVEIVLLNGCDTTKKTVQTPTQAPKEIPKVRTVSDVLAVLSQNEIKAEWLSADVDVSYQGKPQNISANMSVRYKRDSLIWLVVKKFGFTGARAKINKDSVFVINYLQNNYIAENLNYIEKKFNIPADFYLLQNLLIGNPIFLTDKSKLKMDIDASTNDIILRGADDVWQTTYTINSIDLTIKSMLFEQPAQKKSLKIDCENYQILRGYENDAKKIAYLRRIVVNSPESGIVKVELEINDNIEVNMPKATKFDIPSHYEKVD